MTVFILIGWKRVGLALLMAKFCFISVDTLFVLVLRVESKLENPFKLRLMPDEHGDTIAFGDIIGDGG